MMFTAEHTIAVHYAVGRHFWAGAAGGIHGPANHAGREFGAQAGGDGAIGSNTALWYLPGHFEYQLIKRRFIFARRHY